MIAAQTTFACNLDQQFGCGDLLAGARPETVIAAPKATCDADQPLPATAIISPANSECKPRGAFFARRIKPLHLKATSLARDERSVAVFFPQKQSE